jgi:hypothetical protein
VGGCIDEGIPGVSEEELNGFLRIVRERIAPRWDISPEMLTHNKALDLATMQPLEEREDVWAAHQSRETLTPYISRALQMLRNVGLEPNGVTSPWYFGIEVEQEYIEAIATALREVCGVTLGWYFTHLDSESPVVEPRVQRLDPEAGTALVALVSAARETSSQHYDFAWRTQYGEPAEIDAALTADGQWGRLAELYAAGSPMMFHTHWQSLFSNGSGAGLDALEELCERINRWGDRIRWTPARELARYAAARQATQIEVSEDERRLTFRAPFSCFEFTVHIPMPAGASNLSRDGRRLEEAPGAEVLTEEDSWCRVEGGAMVCVPLSDGMELVWS